MAGCGSNSTKESIDFVKHAKSVGASASLVVTPYYNKPSQMAYTFILKRSQML